MAKIRFKGIASTYSDFPRLLKDWFGFKVIVEGKDFIVPSDDPALRKGPMDVLTLHAQIKLGDDLKKIAHQLAKTVPPDFDKYHRKNPVKYNYEIDQITRLTQGYACLLDLTVAQPEKLEHVLADRVLPFMKKEMGAVAVTPISLNATFQQRAISLAKICFLLQRHDSKTARHLVFDKNVMEGILPSQLAPLYYVVALTRFLPLALTLPVERIGCIFHFQGNGMWRFPHVHTIGLAQLFMEDLAPLAKHGDLMGLDGLQHMSEKNIWRYLRCVVDGINTLMRYLNDPRSFLNPETDECDFARQIQAHGAVHLLFSDLLAINHSTNSHHRLNTAFSALDKLANLKKGLGDETIRRRHDSEIFRTFPSSKWKQFLKETISWKFEPHGQQLKNAFLSVIEKTYAQITDGYRNELSKTVVSDNELGDRLWFHRSMRHGTFLKGGKFDSLFGQSAGHVPEGLITLPFILTLGLIFKPTEFIDFWPGP